MGLPPLVYVMGPSGAGKDAVLDFARAALPVGSPVAFAHRYITLSPAEFASRRNAGLFAFHWHAHGTDYGIGIEIETWRRAGFVVVVSGSREHARTLDATALGLRFVLITAPSEVLRQRLTGRGREPDAAIAERLARAAALAVDEPALTVIDNAGPLDQAGRALLALLMAATG
jgi:ribose 1,5-bisphosphokinase